MELDDIMCDLVLCEDGSRVWIPCAEIRQNPRIGVVLRERPRSEVRSEVKE